MIHEMLHILSEAAIQGRTPTELRHPNSEIIIELLDAVNNISFYLKDELSGESHPYYAEEKLGNAYRRIKWAYEIYLTKATKLREEHK